MATLYHSYLKPVLPIVLLASTSPLSSALHPLFSSAPTNSISLQLHAVLAITFFTCLYAAPPKLRRRVGGREALIVCGVWMGLAEATRSFLGVWWSGLGLAKGLWVARVMLEAPVEWAKWITVTKAVEEHSIVIKGVAYTLTCIWLASEKSLSSEIGSRPSCPSWQWQSILCVTGALLLLRSSSTPPTSPSRPPEPPSRTASSRPKPRPQTTQTQPITYSPTLISSIVLLTLTANLLSTFSSRHCLLSLPAPPLRPAPSNTTILASRQSVTGTIVVGEEVLQGQRARYLKADHSLLGGLWVGPARDEIVKEMLEKKVSLWDKVDERQVVMRSESIYSTFILQEIVRLAGDLSKQRRKADSALIIGLGAGLSARALHYHGVNTTIVEIDPVVYEYARDYFGVDAPLGGAFLEDARVFLKRDRGVKYDYIVHDVFTGGTVPASLFTVECWNDVKAVLAPGGVVAVNFAGNVNSPASRLVLTTLVSSFAHCRAFQDGPTTGEYRNVVILCSAHSDLRFRLPVPSDYLNYPSPAIRKRVLETYDEHEWDIRALGDAREHVVRDGEEAKLDNAQLKGAEEHWEIMKLVLPDEAWATY